MKVLFVGFESANNEKNNTSLKWVSSACERVGDEHMVRFIEVPETWDDCFTPLRVQLNQGWDAVICIGYKDTEIVAIERIALNEADVTFKDANGRRPRGKTIDRNGDEGYWSGLPYRELSMSLTNAKIPSNPSHTAGSGVQNFLFYQLMNWISHSRRKLMGGLIQLPVSGQDFSVDAEMSFQFVQCILDTLDRSAKQNDSLMIDLARFEELRDPLKHSKG